MPTGLNRGKVLRYLPGCRRWGAGLFKPGPFALRLILWYARSRLSSSIILRELCIKSMGKTRIAIYLALSPCINNSESQ